MKNHNILIIEAYRASIGNFYARVTSKCYLKTQMW